MSDPASPQTTAHTRLTAGEWKRFMGALSHPIAPNAAMQELMRSANGATLDRAATALFCSDSGKPAGAWDHQSPATKAHYRLKAGIVIQAYLSDAA